MRANPKALLALLGVLFLGACGGDSTGVDGVSGDASGIYAMSTYANHLLPAVVYQDATYTLTFTGGSVTISSDSTFSDTIMYDETTSGQTTSTTSICLGTYSQSGGRLTFTQPFTANPDCGGTYPGTWNGSNTLTIAIIGLAAVYTK